MLDVSAADMSRYPDIICRSFEMVELILVNDGLSSGSESQHFNISEYLKCKMHETHI